MLTTRDTSSGFSTAALVLACLLTAPDAGAWELAEGLDVKFQLRTRYDRNDGRDGDIDNDPFEVIENRARLSFDLSPFPEVRGFFQVQDVRIWGEETDTLFDYSGQGLDIHQAFGELRFFDEDLKIRIGRQEIALDGERIIGKVGWTPQGRSFDAARIIGRTPCGFELTGFVAILSDEDNLFPQSPVNENEEQALMGVVHAGFPLFEDEGFKKYVSALVMYESFELLERKRYTLGLYTKGAVGPFIYRLDGYYQGGEQGSFDVAAFMFGARAGVKLDDLAGLTLQGWFDYLSGDDNPDDATLNTFDQPYGTNHKFYGMADFFLNLPAHTGGRGIIDISAKAGLAPAEGLKLAVHYHHLLAAQAGDGDSDFGDEIDVILAYKATDNFSMVLELFVMLPGSLLEARMGGDEPDVGVYFAVQLDI